MNIKLFSVMGISWLLEIMATLYQQQSFWWSISDVFNCLQGVLVFFVFVFKRKVLVAFQKKLGKNFDHSFSFVIILFTTYQFILWMHDLRAIRMNFLHSHLVYYAYFSTSINKNIKILTILSINSHSNRTLMMMMNKSSKSL